LSDGGPDRPGAQGVPVMFKKKREAPGLAAAVSELEEAAAARDGDRAGRAFSVVMNGVQSASDAEVLPAPAGHGGADPRADRGRDADVVRAHVARQRGPPTFRPGRARPHRSARAGGEAGSRGADLVPGQGTETLAPNSKTLFWPGATVPMTLPWQSGWS